MTTSGVDSGADDEAAGARVRPRQCVFSLLGYYVLPRGSVAVATRTFVETLLGLGVTERAARATIDRMAEEGQLVRHRRGRQAYYTVHPVWEARVRTTIRTVSTWLRDADTASATWTLLSFSIPESRRADRYLLRTELAYRGFGLLRDGLWVALRPVDVAEVLAQLELTDHVEVFSALPMGTEQARALVRRTWDLPALAARCEEFLRRWDDPAAPPGGTGELATHVLLLTEWRQLLRAHPQISLDLLPHEWPLRRCAAVFADRDAELSEPARRQFSAILDALPAPEPDIAAPPAAGSA